MATFQLKPKLVQFQADATAVQALVDIMYAKVPALSQQKAIDKAVRFYASAIALKLADRFELEITAARGAPTGMVEDPLALPGEKAAGGFYPSDYEPLS